jgi:hypothetical protein
MMRSVRADLGLKRQALMQVFPGAPRPPRRGRVSLEQLDVAGWLWRLGGSLGSRFRRLKS